MNEDVIIHSVGGDFARVEAHMLAQSAKNGGVVVVAMEMLADEVIDRLSAVTGGDVIVLDSLTAALDAGTFSTTFHGDTRRYEERVYRLGDADRAAMAYHVAPLLSEGGHDPRAYLKHNQAPRSARGNRIKHKRARR